jgi:hypothetical protein
MDHFSIGSLLNVDGYEYPFRLSHILKRYDNGLVGLTSIWPFLTARNAKAVRLAGSNVEIGAAEAPPWNILDFADVDEDQAAGESRTSGILTMPFELLSSAEIPLSFASDDRKALPYFSAIGVTAFIGGVQVGVIGDYSDFIELRSDTVRLQVFPLLRLERTPTDILERNSDVRNGAMVCDDQGNYIGVIINLIEDGTAYSIAPIEQILNHHTLAFPKRKDIQAWNEFRLDFIEYENLSGLAKNFTSFGKLYHRSQQYRISATDRRVGDTHR